MPLYEIEGVGKESGRKRKPVVVLAKDEKNARAAARRNHDLDPKQIRLITIRHYETQVAGGSFDNADGSSRQKIIRACKPGEFLKLEHEQGNRHDKHATRLLRANGQQLGYVPKEIAGQIYDGFFKDAGCRSIGVVRNAVPYEDDRSRSHLNVLILTASEQSTPSEIASYLEANQVDCPVSTAGSLLTYESLPMEKTIPSRRTAKQSPAAFSPTATTYKRKSKKGGCLFVLALVALAALCFRIM